MTFKIGDKVVEKITVLNQWDKEPLVGTIITPNSLRKPKKDHVWVKWEATWKMDPTLELETNLLPEQEGKDHFNSLLADFQKYENQIKEKMNQVASLIHESNEIAKQAGFSSIKEIYSAGDLLLSSVSECGWRTSSLEC